MGVQVIFNDRVTSHGDTTVAKNGKPMELNLKSGKTLPCDVYVAAYNRGPNTQWLRGLSEDVLNSRNQVITNAHLRSCAYPNLYAMGATTDRPEAALTINVEAQAKTIVANILQATSTKQKAGVKSPPFQSVGSSGFLIPNNLPIPPFMATLCCDWCGYPFNLFCPCFCVAVLCGPVDAMTCGYCCGEPEGEGMVKTRLALKDMKLVANHVGYNNLGQQKQTMER